MIIVLAGPEVVIADLDTYKIYNPDKDSLDISVYACWYDYTVIQSKNPSIDIIWKGYKYTILLSDMINNNACCDNLVFKLHIDLNNKTVVVNKLLDMPIITSYGSPDRQDFNISLGYVKVDENTFNSIFKKIR